ncbi:hypothetical protein COTS27_01569 [Spirochaetota bacterium]|nr:hypothetical protein COTS27_01569 [Spirochaetota bacterium]
MNNYPPSHQRVSDGYYIDEDPGTLLKKNSVLDGWFPLRYSLDIYKTCNEKGGYYNTAVGVGGGSGAARIKVYSNVLEHLNKELPALKHQITHAANRTIVTGDYDNTQTMTPLIGLGSHFNDPFMPLPAHIKHVGGGEVLAKLMYAGYRGLVLTRNPQRLTSLIEAYKDRNRFPTKYFAQENLPIVITAFTLAANEEERTLLEPPSPSLTERMTALNALHHLGVPLGALILSLAPWEEGVEWARLEKLLTRLYEVGVNFMMLTFLFANQTKQVYRHLYKRRDVCHSLAKFAPIAEKKPEHTYDFTSAKHKLERLFRNRMRELGLVFMPPAHFYRSHLSIKDRIAVTLIQMYYLLKELGRRRAFLRNASYHLSLMHENEFAELIRTHKLATLPGIGAYTERIILKMALKNDYEEFDKILMEWYTATS